MQSKWDLWKCVSIAHIWEIKTEWLVKENEWRTMCITMLKSRQLMKINRVVFGSHLNSEYCTVCVHNQLDLAWPVEVIIIVFVIECWIPTTEFHNGIVLIEIHLNSISKYGHFFSLSLSRARSVCYLDSKQKWPIEIGEIFYVVVFVVVDFSTSFSYIFSFETHQHEKWFYFIQHGIFGHKSLESSIQTFAVIFVYQALF